MCLGSLPSLVGAWGFVDENGLLIPPAYIPQGPSALLWPRLWLLIGVGWTPTGKDRLGLARPPGKVAPCPVSCPLD